MTNCKNCNVAIDLNFCPKCGQPSTLHRIDGHYIIHEIEHVLHFERGALYTVKQLVTNPGKSIRDYISENRTLLVKPIIFIIITSLIYSIFNHFFLIEQEYLNYQEVEKTTTGSIFKWVQDHYGYANVMMAVFIALWIKIFFKKYTYNFFEILVLLCYTMGIGMLIFAVFAVIQGITHFDLMAVGGLFAIVYCTWAIGQFFDKNKKINYFKAFVSYMLGIITFNLLALLTGTIIDLVLKH